MLFRMGLVGPPDGASYSSLVTIQLRRGSSANHSIAQLATQCGLTPREEEVLTAISIGLTGKEAACRMKISPNTVKTYLRLIMVKLGVTTRAAIVGRLLNFQSSGEVDTIAASTRVGDSSPWRVRPDTSILASNTPLSDPILQTPPHVDRESTPRTDRPAPSPGGYASA